MLESKVVDRREERTFSSTMVCRVSGFWLMYHLHPHRSGFGISRVLVFDCLHQNPRVVFIVSVRIVSPLSFTNLQRRVLDPVSGLEKNLRCKE